MAHVSYSHGSGNGIRVILSVFAVALMMLTAFQVLAQPVRADSLSDAQDGSGDSALLTNPRNVTAGRSGLANTITESPPLFNSTPAGTIEGFSATSAVTSPVGMPVQGAHIETDERKIVMYTGSGSYIVEIENPAYLGLVSRSGTTLVRESSFVLMSGDLLTKPVQASVVAAGGSSIEVVYYLVAADGSGPIIAKMNVDIVYSGSSPKITANVLSVDTTSAEWAHWRVVWRVAPATGASFHPGPGELNRPLESAVGYVVPSPNYSTELEIPNE